MEAKSEHEDRAYKPGELAPISGVYNAVHARHRSPHEVLAIRGEEFPPCRICQLEVRFHMTHVASHMTHDLDLTGLLAPEAHQKSRTKAAGKRNG